MADDPDSAILASTFLDSALDIAQRAADAAEQVIHRYYATQDFAVAIKADRTPVMHRGELVLGVSAAGEFGERAWAVRSGGAFMRGRSGETKPLRVSTTDAFGADTAISTGNLKSLAASSGWGVLGDLVGRVGRIRGYGDFLHYHLLAGGAIDLVIESDLNILDIAALVVIVREAGGTFTDLHGSAIDVDTRSALAGPPALHALALAAFGAAEKQQA